MKLLLILLWISVVERADTQSGEKKMVIFGSFSGVVSLRNVPNNGRFFTLCSVCLETYSDSPSPIGVSDLKLTSL